MPLPHNLPAVPQPISATVATAAVQPPKDGRRKARREPEVKVEPKAVTFEATETEEPELDKSPVKETAKPAKTSRKTKATEIIEKVRYLLTICFYDIRGFVLCVHF